MHEGVFHSEVIGVMENSNDIPICITLWVILPSVITGWSILIIYQGVATFRGVSHHESKSRGINEDDKSRVRWCGGRF
jgi:hypothetical protein